MSGSVRGCSGTGRFSNPADEAASGGKIEMRKLALFSLAAPAFGQQSYDLVVYRGTAAAGGIRTSAASRFRERLHCSDG